MTLRVYTARVSYDGPDRLDVTRQGADAHRKRHGIPSPGEPFAPSWRILKPALAARRLASRMLEHRPDGDLAEAREAAAKLALESWERYVREYTAEMRASYQRRRRAWDALLARETVTLVCYCTDPARCHRSLLAGMLGSCGAEVLGEHAQRDHGAAGSR